MIVFWLTAVAVLTFILFTWRARQQYKRLLATVEIVTLPAIAATQLGNQRDIQIYLPPGYWTVGDVLFKSLYINDGQDMSQMHLQETLANLYQRSEIEPLVVVAIPTNEERLQEYGTAVAPNAQQLGKKAPQYSHFIIQELIPLIQSQFAVSKAPEDTAVLGVSLGGLSAFDLAWNYPSQFGKVGVFSGSFWWRAAVDDTAVAPGKLIAHEMVWQGEYHLGQRFWFEAGTRDERSDRDNNGVIDAIQDTKELIGELVVLGYEQESEVAYVEVVNGRHNYETWAKFLPIFLKWAFPK